MTAIKNTSIIEGNLASDPICFDKNAQYAARVSFTVMHTNRYYDQEANAWKDGRTSAVKVDMYGRAAERCIQMIQQNPTLFTRGTAIIAWGEISDQPNTWIDKEGKAQATPTLLADRIIPDQITNQRRAQAKANSQQVAGNAQETQQNTSSGFTTTDDDPWASQPTNDEFAAPLGQPAI